MPEEDTSKRFVIELLRPGPLHVYPSSGSSTSSSSKSKFRWVITPSPGPTQTLIPQNGLTNGRARNKGAS